MREGKRESSQDQKGKGKAPRDQKGQGKRAASTHLDPIPLGNQTARTHARTKRNDFPAEHPPTSDLTRKHAQTENDLSVKPQTMVFVILGEGIWEKAFAMGQSKNGLEGFRILWDYLG